jgi:hypothetical protein
MFTGYGYSNPHPAQAGQTGPAPYWRAAFKAITKLLSSAHTGWTAKDSNWLLVGYIEDSKLLFAGGSTVGIEQNFW